MAAAATTFPEVFNIDEATLQNEYFRHVIKTGPHQQLVLMSLQPGEDIGEEIHPETDQFFRIEKGIGELTKNGKVYPINDDFVSTIDAGTFHNIKNTSSTSNMKLYVIYSYANKPLHPHGQIDKTKPLTEVESCFVCAKIPAKAVCSACKKTWYCSKNCQIQDWNGHKRQCTKR